ncbi:MAG: hypothetical protein C5S38_00595 [Candidatus Methanophagaceae archaeon]|nr:MAG: hypothetical protein C5S38_00595 [Methanophagales archaeon]
MISDSACGPPVDAPIIITFLSVSGGVNSFSINLLSTTLKNIFFTFTVEAARTLLISSSFTSSMSKEIVLLGFDTKSTAPYSKDFTARSASILPIAVSITTGTGVFDIIQLKAVNPSILGISMSIVTTSGLSFSVFSTASNPSRAVPTTRMDHAESSISDIILLISDESSTTSTFIIFIPRDARPGIVIYDGISTARIKKIEVSQSLYVFPASCMVPLPPRLHPQRSP